MKKFWRKVLVALKRRIQKFHDSTSIFIQREINKSSDFENVSLLNIGGGMHVLPGYSNVDYSDYGPYIEGNNKHVWNYDLSLGIEVPDLSISQIYLSHTLEHFNPKAGVALLNECFRALNHGGKIRIVLPNIPKTLREYVEDSIDILKIQDNNYIRNAINSITLIPGKVLQLDVVNFSVYDLGGPGGHKCIYDLKSLSLLLEFIGYTNIKESHYIEGFDMDSHKPFSFYLEAEKP